MQNKKSAKKTVLIISFMQNVSKTSRNNFYSLFRFIV